MLSDIFKDTQQKLENSLDHLRSELATLRTSRANPTMVEDLKVKVYDTTMELKELAAISVPDPTTIVIQPWDGNIVENIEKALRNSDLRVNPAVEGTTIRVPVPQLSEERRKEMLKVVGEKCEEARISVRNIRQSKIKTADELEDDGKTSKDECERFKEQVQELVDEYNQKIDKLRKAKKEEISG